MRALGLLFILVLLLGGCAKTVYLEQETPAGTVPMLQSLQAPTMEEGLQGAYQAEVMEVSAGVDNSLIEESFRRAYVGQKQPRIAIYLNRELSDNVREWTSGVRRVINEKVVAQGALKGTNDQSPSSTKLVSFIGDDINKSEDRVTLEGTLAIQKQQDISFETRVADKARRPLRETSEWQFEEGFSGVLLANGANLVDRTAILRLIAADDGKKGSSVKTMEIQALKGYADIFVEILVSERPDVSGDYLFKVSAKEVASGMLLANATVSESEMSAENQQSSRYVATENGFVAQGPDPADAGQILAYELMDSLSKTWSR